MNDAERWDAIWEGAFETLRRLFEGEYDITRRFGIYPSRLSEYAQGRREIPWYVQMDLCMLLDYSPDDILGLQARRRTT